MLNGCTRFGLTFPSWTIIVTYLCTCLLCMIYTHVFILTSSVRSALFNLSANNFLTLAVFFLFLHTIQMWIRPICTSDFIVEESGGSFRKLPTFSEMRTVLSFWGRDRPLYSPHVTYLWMHVLCYCIHMCCVITFVHLSGRIFSSWISRCLLYA